MRALVLYRYCAHSRVSARHRTVPGRALTGLAAGWVTDGVGRRPSVGPANPYVLERHALDRHTCHLGYRLGSSLPLGRAS